MVNSVANAIQFIHRAAVVHQIRKPFCTSTPIFNRQVTKEKGLDVLYTTVGSPCMLYM